MFKLGMVGLLVAMILGCTQSPEETTIDIACAANMNDAMDSIATLAKEKYGIHCNVTAASSGMLTAQIENGAPYDLFFSANMAYPDSLYKKGKGEKTVVYAEGQLILVLDKHSPHTNLKDALQDPTVQRIGIAEFETAPYGMAARQYLKRTGQLELLSPKLVIGESIGQVNQYITTHAVDIAFTSYSFKITNKDRYAFIEVPADLFAPIEQGAMILKHGIETNETACRTFMDFMASDECKTVLEHFGYRVK